MPGWIKNVKVKKNIFFKVKVNYEHLDFMEHMSQEFHDTTIKLQLNSTSLGHRNWPLRPGYLGYHEYRLKLQRGIILCRKNMSILGLVRWR